MTYLISPQKKQYKANLHCHSTLSDGKKTPEALKEAYRNQGYKILAITDHDRPYSHQDLCEKDFLLLTGYEAYFREGDSQFSSYKKEIHLNLFAKDPANVTMIAFDERYCRYLKRDNALESLQYAGEPEERVYSVSYVNHFISTALENGYLVSYNHAYWCMEAEEDVLSYNGCFSMEVYNHSSYLMNGLDYNAALYDKMLRLGKRVYCHAADDNHNRFPDGHPSSDSFGGFTMIFPEEFTYDSVMEAMEKGEMYASSGPLIHSLSVEGNILSLACSGARSVHVNFGGKKTAYQNVLSGEEITSASFEIPDTARYVRVTVVDHEGKRADTRGYFREEFGFLPLENE